MRLKCQMVLDPQSRPEGLFIAPPLRAYSFPGLTGICSLFYREISGNLPSL